MDKSLWIQMHSIPEKDCIILDRNINEFWAISKGSANLNIFKWDNNNNKFVKYEHCIQNTDKLSYRLSACFDENNKNILYIINCLEIIIMDINSNTYQQIEVKLDYKTAVSAVFENKLNIIAVNNDQKSFDHLYLSPKHELILRDEIYRQTQNLNETPFLFLEEDWIHLYDGEFLHYADEESWGSEETEVKHPFIEIHHNKKYPLIHFSMNEIIINVQNNYNNQIKHKWRRNNIQCPINPRYYVLCKQSSFLNTLLLNGFFRRVISYKNKNAFIPVDIIKLLNQYFVLYNIHLFDDKQGHCMISLDRILENIPKFVGIVKSYDKGTKTGKVEVKNTIDGISDYKFLPKIPNDCNYDNPSKLHKPLITALKNMFNIFASNDNGTMSIDDMRKYIIHCGAGEHASEVRIKSIFVEHGGTDLELSWIGFIDFYAQAIDERPDHVVNDLDVFGYKDEIINGIDGKCIDAVFDDIDMDKLKGCQRIYFNIILDNDGKMIAIKHHVVDDEKTEISQ